MIFTFEGIKAETKNRLSLLSNWADTLYYGVYERIIDVVAYTVDKLVYLAEYFYNEANWSTATQLDSIMHKVKWLCYTPHRMKGAAGDIILSGDPIFSIAYLYTYSTVIIPRWTTFTNEDGNSFVYSTEEKIYSNDFLGPLTIPVKEGIVIEYIHTAIGNSSEEISLFFNNIDNDEIEIEIVNTNDEKIYDVGICGIDEETRELILVLDLDNYWCQIENAYDFQSIKITFGDGIRNKKLNAGERILIRYAETKGSEGNITNAGVLTVIQDTILDTGGTEATLYVINEEEISDGSDVEDIESIRINAPQLFQSGYRAGSRDDWESILNALSYINKAKVWSAHDAGDDTATNAGKVYICAVTSDGTDLTTAQKTQLESDLDNYKSVTEVITFQDLEKTYIMFDISATITNKPESEIDDLLFTILDNNYGVLNVDFQTNVYQSNYIRLIDQLDDVLFHETDVYYLQKEVSYIETELELTTCIDASDPEDDIILTSGSVGIWIQRKVDDEWISGATDYVTQVAESSTLISQFTGTNGYIISGGSFIDYEDATVSFTISTIANDPTEYGVENPTEANPTGYVLSVSYKTHDGNENRTDDIRLGSQTNITDIDENFIFTTYEYE